MMKTMKKTGPDLSEEELAAFEMDKNVQLPEDYRNFMLRYNGGQPVPKSFNFPESESGSSVGVFYPIKKDGTNSLQFVMQQFEGRVPEELLPVAGDMFGNQICLGLEGENRGKVFFWDHEMEPLEGGEPDYANIRLLASTFDEFLDSLFEREFLI
jgi:hypothetical protein